MTTALIKEGFSVCTPLRIRDDSKPGAVLIVDDEPQNRMLLKDALETRGYEIAEAENGLQALRMVADSPPDVVLLDVMMPKLDGFEVCRRLKNFDKTAQIPVLLLTALSDRKERLIGIEAGANDFLSKPIDFQDVVIRVSNAVSMKRLYDNLQAERQKTDQLLLNVLPRSIADRMKKGEVNIADSFPEATVLLADLVGFTMLSAQVGAEQVVSLLNEIFSEFDVLCGKHGLEKIKTIGDGYMVAGGIPFPKPDHAEAAIAMALNMHAQVHRFNSQYSTSLRIRIGINSGPVIAGVIGRKKFAYDMWGDTVNTACRLATLGDGTTIQVTENTFEKVGSLYQFGPKRKVEIRGHGEIIVCDLIEQG